jgi:putative transposase
MKNTKIYKKRLPHIQPQNGDFFVTFRLKVPLPEEISKIVSMNYVRNKKKGKNPGWSAYSEYFTIFDNYLDFAKTGPKYLADPTIADMICEAIEYRDGIYYDLICYTIMSNHIHMVVVNTKDYLFNAMQSLKGYTAREANKILDRKGSFWQVEYYDHLFRDKNDFFYHIKYTINNPVKAGLVTKWNEWKYTYLKDEYHNNPHVNT